VWACIRAFLHQPDAPSKEEFVVDLRCVRVLERTLSRAVVVDVVAAQIGRDDIEGLFEYIKHGLGYLSTLFQHIQEAALKVGFDDELKLGRAFCSSVPFLLVVSSDHEDDSRLRLNS
jgi:hypothetical protein